MPEVKEPLPRLHLIRQKSVLYLCPDQLILERAFFAAIDGDKASEQFLINTASSTYDSDGQSNANYSTYLYQLLYWLRRNPGHTQKQITKILENAVESGITPCAPQPYIAQYSPDPE